MLIQHIAESREGGLDAATDEDVADLQALYKASKKRFDLEEDFKARARAAVTRLQGGDPQSEAAWRRICEASRREFEAIYERLGVSNLQERGESFYNPMLPGVVKDLQAAGVAVEDNGAQVVWCEGIENPLIVQKSDGKRERKRENLSFFLSRSQGRRGVFSPPAPTKESQKLTLSSLFQNSLSFP